MTTWTPTEHPAAIMRRDRHDSSIPRVMPRCINCNGWNQRSPTTQFCGTCEERIAELKALL